MTDPLRTRFHLQFYPQRHHQSTGHLPASSGGCFEVSVNDEGIPITQIYVLFVQYDTGMPNSEWVSGLFEHFELIK
jgi:hypothetical protein